MAALASSTCETQEPTSRPYAACSPSQPTELTFSLWTSEGTRTPTFLTTERVLIRRKLFDSGDWSVEVHQANQLGLEGYSPEQLPHKTEPSPWQPAARQGLSSRHRFHEPSKLGKRTCRALHFS